MIFEVKTLLGKIHIFYLDISVQKNFSQARSLRANLIEIEYQEGKGMSKPFMVFLDKNITFYFYRFGSWKAKKAEGRKFKISFHFRGDPL